MSLKSKKDLNAVNARKQKVVTSGTGYPSRNEGHTGDIIIRRVPQKGLHLFVKYGQRWYSIPLEEKTNSKYDRDRIIAKPRRPKESPYNHEIAAVGDDIIIKIDEDNTHTLGKSSSRILRNVNGGDPQWEMGSSDTELFRLIAKYDGGKGLDKVQFISLTDGGSTDDGAFEFYVDGAGGANKRLTVGDTVSVIGQLSTGGVLSSADIITNATNKITLDGASGHTYIHEVSDDKLDIVVGNTTILEVTEGGGGANDSVAIQALNKLYFDGAGDTYITESAADTLDFVVGGDTVIQIDENGISGNIVGIDGCIAFKHGSDNIYQPVYGDVVYTTNTGNNTDIDFRECQKARLELTGGQTVAVLGFVFPEFSGNFTIALEQDSSGSGVVTAYKAINFAGTSTTDVKFPGGTNPTLTTTANKTDIISIFWDAENYIAYAAATLNF